MRWRRRKPTPQAPIYFPCPECGRPVDALNTAAIDAHAKAHADSFLARLEKS